MGTPIFESVADGFPQAEFKPPTLLDKPKRPKRAQEYEKRVAGTLNGVMRACAANPATVPDAAALIVYSDGIASKAGDLADADPKFRAMLDFISSGTENPYLAMALATMPLALQVIRNHETKENTDVGFSFRIPFTKRTIRVPFRIRLKNPLLRSVTEEPKTLSNAIFGNPMIQEKLREARVDVAWSGQ